MFWTFKSFKERTFIMKYSNNRKYFILTLISILLFFVAVASTAAFMLNRVFINKKHNLKWRDYDECGMF